MTLKIKIFILLVCLFFCDCSNNSKQSEKISLRHKAIDLGEDFIGYGGFLTFHDNKIIGMEMAPTLPPFFCLEIGRAHV